MTNLEEHYRDNFDRLCKQYAKHFEGGIMDAEDLIHDAYVKALKATYEEGKATFGTWFERHILPNAFKSMKRRVKDKGMVRDDHEEGYTQDIEEKKSYYIPSCLDSMEFERYRDEFKKIIKNDKQATILTDYFILGYSRMQTAERNKCNEKTVRRAVKRLAQKLGGV